MIVMFVKVGFLGNRLINFANLIAFGVEHRISVINPAFEEYAQYFEGTATNLLCRFPSPLLRISKSPVTEHQRSLAFRLVMRGVRASTRLGLDRSLLPIVRADDDIYLLDDNPDARDVFRKPITFAGGLQFRDLSSMEKHGDVIREYFLPVKIHRDNVERVIEQARQSVDVLVGVHIRAGDYAEHLGGRYFYPVADYIRMMKEVVALFPSRDVGFLVCSNGPIDTADFEGLKVAFGTGQLIEDMYSFARCDYVFGPPSTFTLWSSFHGGVPLCFVNERNETLSIDRFRPYFSLVEGYQVLADPDGSQYLMINSVRYNLRFNTLKSRVSA